MLQQPITILAEDFQRNLVALINGSGLPFFAIRGILKDCIEEVTIAGQKQLATDRQHYNEALLKTQQENAEKEQAE